jgi:hypothetical protein
MPRGWATFGARARAAARRAACAAVTALAAAATLAHEATLLAATAARATLPASTLAVWRGGRWVAWWRSAEAPARWSAPAPAPASAPALAADVRWRAGAPGVEWGELRLAGTGEAWRLRVVVVRLDPRHVRLSLAAAVAREVRRGAWTIDAAGADAVLALNAGQFRGATPWGWVVHAGREHRAPGAGPLAPAVVVDEQGGVRVVPADSIAALRAAWRGGAVGTAGVVREAFQSYPALLAGGEVPAPLRAPGGGVDVAHRDARLALGTLPDGRVLLALTRFDALGPSLDVVPFGPTVPEMAAIMGALGARDAVLLDGGISSQLLVRDARDPVDAPRRWPGLRAVPLGLVGVVR